MRQKFEESHLPKDYPVGSNIVWSEDVIYIYMLNKKKEKVYSCGKEHMAD